MKKTIAFIIAIVMALLCLCSCNQTPVIKDFSPILTVESPYSVSGNVISAVFYNCGIISPLKSITFSEGEAYIYYDEKKEEYLDSEYFIPELGLHDYNITVYSEDKTQSVSYVLRIHNITVKSLYIEPLYEKQYAIGEIFDRKSVLVYTIDDSGSRVGIDRYECDYSFSEEGTATVVISVGKIRTEMQVTVLGTFKDVLDDKKVSSTGAKYDIIDDHAILVDGSNVKGAFSLPESITYKGTDYPVTEIKNNAFSSNENITSVIIPHPVVIGESAFMECNSLVYASMCSGTEIGRFAFAYCVSLSSVVLPGDLKILQDGTFTHCSSLKISELPETLEKIESQVFSFCESIESMSLPQGTKYIGARSFKSCYSLTTMVCGAKLEEAGDGAFSDNPALKTLIISSNTNVKDDSVIYGDDQITVYAGSSSILIYFCNKSGIPFVKLKENSAQLLISKDRFSLNDEIRDSEIGLIINSEEYLGFAPNYGLSYDLSVPGDRVVKVNYEDYSSSVDVFVEYKVVLAGEEDEEGNIYEFDSGKAYLSRLAENVEGGKYILPTSVIRGEEEYEVVGVKSGALNDCKNLSKMFLHSKTTLLEDNAISNCSTLKLLYFGTPKGIYVKMGEGNFEGLSEDFIILCSNVNATVMYNYVRSNNIKYAGLERDELYITSTKSATRLYSPGDEFDPTGFNIMYIDSDWNCIDLYPEEVEFSYDFTINNIVTVIYGEKTATYGVTLE
ncbi:MAG: leucine-rich repeat domain-containing protein [Clostridiales bacterium]|nr:leucine-rich repeat domain-containing protein [Clostridiales bacterium]